MATLAAVICIPVRTADRRPALVFNNITQNSRTAIRDAPWLLRCRKPVAAPLSGGADVNVRMPECPGAAVPVHPARKNPAFCEGI
ncbi:MAG TPA: hypothetical protein VEN30_04090 [Paraburkholderia sp.]|nr:hypothetical protein [Paraburkholderia sp.]